MNLNLRLFQVDRSRTHAYLIMSDFEETKNATNFCSTEWGFERARKTSSSQPPPEEQKFVGFSLFFSYTEGCYFKPHSKERKVTFLT